LPGGILESAGRLFKRALKMYVYPTRDPASGKIYTVETVSLPSPWQQLRDILLELDRLKPIRRYNESYLKIFPQDVLAKIQRHDPSWEDMVPPLVAAAIRANNLFSYQGSSTTAISKETKSRNASAH
jgi:hypothetical protein